MGSPMGAPGGPLGEWSPERDDDTGKKKGKKKRSPEDKATRSVANKRRILAVGLALLAGALLFLGSSEPPAETTFAANTTRPLAALTELTPAHVGATELELEQVPDGAFTGETAEEAIAALLEEHEGARIRYPMDGNQLFSLQHLQLTDQLAVDLGADERLVSIDSAIARSVGGDLSVGDVVDIYGVAEGLISVVVSGAEIVDITLSEEAYRTVVTQQSEEGNRDKPVSELLPGDPLPGTYTLRVKVDEAARLFLVSREADLYLAYRAPGAEAAPVGPRTLFQVLCGLDRAELDQASLDALPAQCLNEDGEPVGSGSSVGADDGDPGFGAPPEGEEETFEPSAPADGSDAEENPEG